MNHGEKTKKIVEKLLREDPRCRNDDRWLIICVLREFGIKFWIDYRKLEEIPAFESITRCRRIIQNKENKYNAERFIPEEGITYESPNQ